jgi:replication factor A3
METITTNPALFANAELFKRLQGRRVRTVVKILQADGGTIQGQSPDGPTITIRNVVKNEEFTPFVEVIGVVEGDLSLRCEKCTNFGEKFGGFSLPHSGPAPALKYVQIVLLSCCNFVSVLPICAFGPLFLTFRLSVLRNCLHFADLSNFNSLCQLANNQHQEIFI